MAFRGDYLVNGPIIFGRQTVSGLVKSKEMTNRDIVQVK
jgi:hypothetical protein